MKAFVSGTITEMLFIKRNILIGSLTQYRIGLINGAKNQKLYVHFMMYTRNNYLW